MADKTTKPTLSAQQVKMINMVRDSGAVDFDRLGKLVAKAGTQVFDPGMVATDYIASAYTSIIKVWETGALGSLEQINTLKEVAPVVARPRVTKAGTILKKK